MTTAKREKHIRKVLLSLMIGILKCMYLTKLVLTESFQEMKPLRH